MQTEVMRVNMTNRNDPRRTQMTPQTGASARHAPPADDDDSDGDAAAVAHHAPPPNAAAPQPPPKPQANAATAGASPHDAELVEVEGTGCRYILRDEIGRGAYGKVYLTDVIHTDPMQSPLSMPPPPQSSSSSSPQLPNQRRVNVNGNGINFSSSTISNGQRNSCSTSSTNAAGRMVLKRMENASMEDGLQAATLREFMVLDEVSMGSFDRERSEVEAFTAGNVVFRAAPSTVATRPHDAAAFSFSETSNHNVADADDRWNDEVLAASVSRNDDYDYFSAALRRRINFGRNFLIGMRDTIMLPQEHLAYVAMDYCEGGDLWHFIRDMKVGLKTSGQRFGEAMPAKVFRRWAVELILALAFLHARNISHRDLKPQNLMLAKRTDMPIATAQPPPSASAAAPSPRTPSDSDSDDEDGNGNDDDGGRHARRAAKAELPAGEQYNLKVGDFGLSRLEDIPYKKYVHEAVTLWYRSPDVLLGNTNYTYSADAWSLGCILVEMASGSVLFKGRDEPDELRHIFTRGCRPSLLNFPRMKDYPYAEKFESVLEKYRDKESEEKGTTGDPADGEAALQLHVEKLARHIRAFLKERNAQNLLGVTGIDLVARLLVFDPERRFTVLQAVRHRFFTDAYAEVYGSD